MHLKKKKMYAQGIPEHFWESTFDNRLKIPTAEFFPPYSSLVYNSLPTPLSRAFMSRMLNFLLEKEAVSTWMSITV